MVRIDIPATLHPDNIRYDDPASQLAKAALTELYSVASEIADTAAVPGISTPKLAETTTSVATRQLAAMDTAAGQALHHVATQQKVIDSKILAPVPADIASQVRSWAASQTSPVRALLTVIQTDARAASAVLSAPAFLSGLTNEEHDLLREAAEKTHAPEQVTLRGRAQAAFDTVSRARDTFSEQTAKLVRTWSTDAMAARALARLAKKG